MNGVDPRAATPNVATPSPFNLRQPAPPADTREAVRKLAHQLESVFVNQLFQAMRASVPENKLLENAPGHSMFTSLMDEKLASEVADQLHRGIGESLYRQLAKRLPEEGTTP
jgi:Rod binding domain-containing protein